MRTTTRRTLPPAPVLWIAACVGVVLSHPDPAAQVGDAVGPATHQATASALPSVIPAKALEAAAHDSGAGAGPAHATDLRGPIDPAGEVSPRSLADAERSRHPFLERVRLRTRGPPFPLA